MLPLIVCCLLAGIGCWLNLPLHPDSWRRWLGYCLVALPLGALLGWLVTAPAAEALSEPVRRAALIVVGTVALVAAGSTILAPEPRMAIRSFSVASAAVAILLGLHGAALAALALVLAAALLGGAVTAWERRRSRGDGPVDEAMHEPFLACMAGALLATALLFVAGEATSTRAEATGDQRRPAVPSPAFAQEIQQREQDRASPGSEAVLPETAIRGPGRGLLAGLTVAAVLATIGFGITGCRSEPTEAVSPADGSSREDEPAHCEEPRHS